METKVGQPERRDLNMAPAGFRFVGCVGEQEETSGSVLCHKMYLLRHELLQLCERLSRADLKSFQLTLGCRWSRCNGEISDGV